MLKSTDAPKNKNAEKTCTYSIPGRTKQYGTYACSILFYQSYFIMPCPLLHATLDSKMNSKNQDVNLMCG
jgi:hypothetical protein